MKVSDKGAVEIAEHEGIVVAPYRDSMGFWTWGIGHTASAGGINPATMSKAMPSNIDGVVMEALDVFKDDLAKFEARVNDAVKVTLTQYQFDALVSFDFNTGGIYKARLTKLLNAGDKVGAAAAFMGWTKPPEIIGRRKAEMNLFITGSYDGNGDAVPIYGTNGAGKLGKRISVMRGAEILAKLDRKPAAKAGLIAMIISFIAKLFGGAK